MENKFKELSRAGFMITLQKLADFLGAVNNNEPVKALKLLENFEQRDLVELGAIAGYLADESGLFKVIADRANRQFSNYFYARSPEDARKLVVMFYGNEEFVELVGGALMGCILALDEEPETKQILH